MSDIKFRDLLNKRVILTGIAKNGKAGAILLINDFTIYLKGFPLWSDNLYGLSFKVEGILKKEKIIPDPYIGEDGAISQGALGKQYVIENAKIIR